MLQNRTQASTACVASEPRVDVSITHCARECDAAE
jgi:hypothetical protein